MEFTVIILVLIALVVFTIYKGVKMVSQGEKWIIQRLGKYHQTLEPGLNFIIPYVDNVAYKVTTKDIVLDIP
ncbi:SPFH domain-containing protein, partial [Moraxella catarrhalis]